MSLVARYEFDDPATFTADATGNGNTLTDNNSVGTFTDPTYGTTASFSTSVFNHFILPAAPTQITGSSSRTFSYWVRYNGPSNFSIIHGQGTTGSDEYRVQFSSSNELTSNRSSGVAVIPDTLTLDQWYHFVETYDGTSERIYIDGVLKDIFAVALTTETGPLWIAGSPRYPGNFTLNGQLLDFRIYDDALSATDITDLQSGGPNPVPPTVNWVLDANSKYEISSKEHLIQLMHEGTLYTNEGSVPGQTTDWYGEDYIQTVDIDLLGDSTNIKPIGVSANFTGEYDGNGFTVSNWSYVDTSPTDPFVGFFGFINNGTVKNLRLAGVCTITGFHTYAGMLAGRVGNGTVYNIEVDLSPGSHITQGDTNGTQTIVGGVFGWIVSDFATCTAITLRGQLDSIVPNANTTYRLTGGISGDMAERASLTLARNLATFPSGLSGGWVGGIVGRLAFATLSKVLNAMTGDITNNLTGTSYLGGIVGYALQGNVSSQSEWINSMKGNITNSSLYSGGIVGRQKPEVGFQQYSWMNYMGGDITSSYRAGGMFGLAAAATSLVTSINAMNGAVVDPVLAENSDIASAPITIDTSYGLTFTTNVTNATTTPIAGLPTDSETGLPIVDLTATDGDGVVHTFEFLFGNVPRNFNQFQITSADVYISMAELEIYDMTGVNIALLGTASSNASQNASHAPRGNDGNTDPDFSSGTVTDLYLSTGGVTWTLELDREYALAEINKVVFYNSATSQERAIGSTIAFNSPDGGAPEQVGVLTSDSIQEFVVTPAPEFLLPTPRVSSISATVVEVAGAFAYRITVTDVAAGTTSTVHNGISTGDVTIRSLSPETNYVLQLFANSGSGYDLVDTEHVTTLANSPSNYDKTTFGSNGKFDLTVLDDSSFALLGEVMNDVFTTGEELEINIGARKSKVAFVKRGESVSTDDSILAPFSSTAGSGQAFTMNLSDSSAVSVAYDETNNSLDIGGATVQVGGSIVIDGKKLTASDI